MKTKTKGILCVLGGFMMHLILGTLYMWGGVNVYVRSYYCYNGTNALPEGVDDCEQCSLSQETVGIVFPLMFQALSGFLAFGVPTSRKIGVKLLSIIGVLILCASVFISTFAKNFWLFSVFYGFLFGALSGLIYMLPFNNGHLYFPGKKGLISGLISSGFGLGALVFGQIFKAAINPDNQPQVNGCYPRDVANKLPDVLRYLTIAYVIISVGGAFLQTPPTEEELQEIEEEQKKQEQTKNNQISDPEIYSPLQNNTDGENSELQNQNKTTQEVVECPDAKTALQHPKLYITFAQNFCLACVGVMLASNYQPYANYFPNLSDPDYIQWVNNVGSVMNFVSRIFWGKMMDVIDFKTIIKILAVCQAIIISTIPFAAHTKGTFLFYILMSFFCYGGLYSVMPTQSAKMFGKKVGLTAVGIIFQGFSMASWTEFLVLRIATAGADHDQKQHIYTTIFRIYWIIPVIGFIMVWFIKYEINWKQYLNQKGIIKKHSNDQSCNSLEN